MKLISRKAITATIAAAAISTASLTAPAMAQTTTETTTPVTTTAPAPATDNGSSDMGSSSDNTGDKPAADLSSELFTKTDKDGKTVEMTTGEKLKEIISILTGIGAFFGALITINNNIDRLMKTFKI